MRIALVLLSLACYVALGAETRHVQVASTETAPVVDGKLDEPCWQQAKTADDFRRFTEGTPAHESSEARLLIDDTHLYVAFRCEEPRMDLVGQDVARNPDVFNYGYGNNVEIFLDPGGSKRHYWQFMVNTNGYTQANLATHDVMHLGTLDWQASVFLGDSFFSVEVAIPFALLHLTPDAGRTWGLNLCRARQIGKKDAAYTYSSWQPMQGSFLRPELFGALHIDADLSRFCYAVTIPEENRQGERSLVTVANLTGRTTRVRIGILTTPMDGIPSTQGLILTLAPDKPVTLDAGLLTATHVGAETRLTIVDATTDERLFYGATQTLDVTD